MKSRRQRTQRGGAMVELALCLVPFIMFLWATLSFGHAVFAYNNVAFLAREGSRWAAVRGANSGRVADQTGVSTFTKTKSAGLDKTKLTVTASWSHPSKTPGSLVTVNVSYVAATLPLAILDGPLTVRSTSTATILQ